MLSTEALLQISKEVGAPVSRVETTISLLENGATVPFIARYRKEATGNLDDVKIQDIDERRAYYAALDLRRETVLSTIERQGKLTEELKQKILLCFSKNELEDLYLPFKPKRKTRALAALERGLGPLADYIWEQTGTEPVAERAQQFVSPPEPEPQPVEPTVSVSELPADPVEPTVSVSELPADPVEPTVSVSELPADPVEPTVSVSELPADLVEPSVSISELPADLVEPSVSISELPADLVEPSVSISELPAREEKPAEPVAVQPAAPPEKAPMRVENAEQAIEGALHIIAERIAENPEYRKQLRDRLLKTGVVRARVQPGKESEKTKYEMYYKFEETVQKIPSHRMLAIRRGSRENVLSYSIETDNEQFIAALMPQVIRESTSQFAPFLERAIRDSYDRLLAPSIQNEVRSILRERSEMEAIKVFEENLRTLLLSPPAGPIGAVGIDPGIRTGCKIAVVDETGKFIENHTIHLTEPHKDVEGAEKVLVDFVQKHNARAVTIGNGTASRETESFVRSVVQKHGLDVFVVVVSEAGASVYSASKRAREEFPNLDVTVRGAISIARRLQDPLAEFVKVEPRSIGVGQYQHDVDQKKLKHSLEAAVQSCVNRVGVNLNTASEDLLKYVSGINDRLASEIIARRSQAGMFRDRTQLMEIDGFGERTFEQAAGFLRIKEGTNPLDRTGVHPESYPLVEKIAATLGTSVGELIENPAKVNAVDFKAMEGEAGRFTLADIREELLRPGRDPRDKFVAPKFREDVKELVDLKEGMELEGTVTNVTNFGAFVDLGVHQDGLVHISELSHKYVQDAREAVKVGDIVKVKVIGVDATMKRISLSIKALQPKPPRPPRRRKRPVEAPAPVAANPAPRPRMETPAPRPAPPPKKARPAAASSTQRQERAPKPAGEHPKPAASSQSMEDKIRALQEKFGRVG